ncbi:hypothetical protein B6U99_00055 [Candidatus Geothermarchaeota archaeon ex4572_27]|nr:MAG: hypothetical protein B6U99_00055 [Candidatus Geothermarchaeota archaeon ex4572_27]
MGCVLWLGSLYKFLSDFIFGEIDRFLQHFTSTQLLAYIFLQVLVLLLSSFTWLVLLKTIFDAVIIVKST